MIHHAFDASDGVYPSSPTTGDTYRVSVAGNVSGTDYAVGDIAIYNGSAWDHFQMEDHAVLSVNGQNVSTAADAGRELQKIAQGRIARLLVWRGDGEIFLTVRKE